MWCRALIAIPLLLAASGPAIAKARKLSSKPSVSSTSFSLGLTQMQGARLKPITQASLSASYSPSSQVQLGASQSFTKNYLINQDGDEFVINDTNLYLGTALMMHDALSFSASLSTTLPASERSQRYEIQTITSLSGGVDYRPWQILSLGAGLGGSYHFNKYDTEPTGEQGTGAALPHYSLYAEQSASLSFLKDGFLGYAFTFTETYYHKIEEDAPNSTSRDISDQAYQIRVFTGYAFSYFTVSLGFIQGTLLELPGIKDYVLFDEERSIGFVSLSTKF
jgi:hypothetical protein